MASNTQGKKYSWQEMLIMFLIPLLGLAASYGSISSRLDAVEDNVSQVEQKQEQREARIDKIAEDVSVVRAIVERIAPPQ